MIIRVPKWNTKAGEQLDKLIKKIALDNDIDIIFVEDSKNIEDGKVIILNALWRISERVESGIKKVK